MNHKLISLGVGVAILATSAIATVAPAAAGPCPGGTISGTTSKTVATVGGCFVVYARIDKHFSGSPQAFIGPQSRTTSVVTKTGGTFVYHYAKWYDSIMYWDSGWVRG